MYRKRLKIWRSIKHLLEAAIVYTIYGLLYILPIDWASYLGGFLIEKLCSKLRVNEIGISNLTICFPELSIQQKRNLLRKMWNNLGRVIGEMPHWYRISKKEFDKRVVFESSDNFSYDKGAILASGHFGNWELSFRIAQEMGMRVNFLYMPLANRWVDWLLNYSRKKTGLTLYKKGAVALRAILKKLHCGSGEILGLLIDQKIGADGVYSAFFGTQVRTISLPAQLHLKFDIPIVMVKIQRTVGAHYTVSFTQIKTEDIGEKRGGASEDLIMRITMRMNQVLEDWIRNDSSQWFWVHKRWQ